MNVNLKTLSRAVEASSVLRSQQCLAKNALKSIKTQNPGYICPDGTINFQSAEAAENYAKNVVVKALNQKNPYEKSVVIDKNRIIYEKNGDDKTCPLKLGVSGTWVHGHPDLYAKGCTFPFSSTDYTTFISMPKLEKAVIYNSRGEKAELTKIAPGRVENLLAKLFPQYNITSAKAGICSGGYNAALITDKNARKELNRLSFKTLWAMMTKNKEAAKKYSEQNMTLYNKMLQEAISEKGARSVHNFWVKNAPKLDVAYSTNFSNLG